MLSLRSSCVALLVVVTAAPVFAGLQYQLPKLPDGMKRVEGRSYVLIHDLTDSEAAEVIARMDAMAQEYQQRTRDLRRADSGQNAVRPVPA